MSSTPKKQHSDGITKVLKMIEELPKEEFQKQLFPSREFYPTFIELVKWNESEIELVKRLSLGKTKFENVRHFLTRLKAERGFDPMFDNLHKDEYAMTKKISSHEMSKDFIKKMDSGEKIHYEILCDEYAKLYERTCKRYFKPLAKLITQKQIRECGVCIDKIKKFEPKMNLVLEPYIPQIRNSINHSDCNFDKRKQVIVFDDDDKPSIEKTEKEIKDLIRAMIESELSISAAHSSFKLPLWKAIILDTEATMKYCKILNIDFNKLMMKFLPKGYSIFNIKFVLERAVLDKSILNC